MSKTKNFNFTKTLTESAVMLALTVVLSYLKLLDLPYGGSITLCSMVPPILIAYRHGLGWGLSVGLANGLLQLLMGVSNLSYATSATAAVCIILLDYLLAFTVTGLGGIFKKTFKSQTTALALGTALVCILRYAFHVVSGCTVWAGLSIPTNEAFIYSVCYNATYMLPELLIAVIGAVYIGGAVGLSGDNLTRIAKKGNKTAFVLRAVGMLFGAATFIADILLIAPHLQNPDSGDFDITGIMNVDFGLVAILTALGAFLFGVFMIIARKKDKK